MRNCHCARLMMPLMLVFLPLAAGAQDDGYLAKETSLWFNTSNAAGIGVKDLQVYNTADIGYLFESGSYHRMQEGSDCGTLSFNTQGATKVGKIQLWGQFSYDNITANGTRFNTLVFDPFDERFIYNVADPVESQWKRQAYDMEFKLSFPIGRKLHGGLHARYYDRIAAKQNDPRAESTSYDVFVRPSLVFRMGNRSSLGVDLGYSHMLERSAPTLSNGSILQNVYVLRGLGNYTEDIVGSGGLYTMYYTCNAFGGHVQYALDSDIGLVVEAGGEYKPTGLRQDAAHPRDMGRANVADITLDIQALFGQERILHKFSLDALYRMTDGIEYSTKQIQGSGWEVLAESIMSTYRTLSADLAYNCFITGSDGGRMAGSDAGVDGLAGDSFIWDFMGKVSYFSKDDKYLSPVSRFHYSGLSLTAGARRRFMFKRSTLDAGLDLTAMKSFGGGYEYSGVRSLSIPVNEWYPSDLNHLTADYLRTGLSLSWLHRTASSLSYGLTLTGAFLTAGSGNGTVSISDSGTGAAGSPTGAGNNIGVKAGNRFFIGGGLKLVF
ncbi:MAG: DUF6850 family outer membrane beta-barrel protein [Candidatus Cryptobacteroides sp.]